MKHLGQSRHDGRRKPYDHRHNRTIDMTDNQQTLIDISVSAALFSAMRYAASHNSSLKIQILPGAWVGVEKKETTPI